MNVGTGAVRVIGEIEVNEVLVTIGDETKRVDRVSEAGTIICEMTRLGKYLTDNNLFPRLIPQTAEVTIALNSPTVSIRLLPGLPAVSDFCPELMIIVSIDGKRSRPLPRQKEGMYNSCTGWEVCSCIYIPLPPEIARFAGPYCRLFTDKQTAIAICLENIAAIEHPTRLLERILCRVDVFFQHILQFPPQP